MVDWVPKTRLGHMVLNEEVKTMSEALATKLPLREAEIVDVLLPDLQDEVINLKMVQRMTDSGRRVRFAVTCIVGNGDGFIGVGRAKGKEVGPTIKKAIDNAKLNIIEIKRGCGSWECGCGTVHTLPFEVVGRSGSVTVTLRPAPAASDSPSATSLRACSPSRACTTPGASLPGTRRPRSTTARPRSTPSGRPSR